MFNSPCGFVDLYLPVHCPTNFNLTFLRTFQTSRFAKHLIKFLMTIRFDKICWRTEIFILPTQLFLYSASNLFSVLSPGRFSSADRIIVVFGSPGHFWYSAESASKFFQFHQSGEWYHCAGQVLDQAWVQSNSPEACTPACSSRSADLSTILPICCGGFHLPPRIKACY